MFFSSKNTSPSRVCRYEVRVEACTVLGCSSSDWSSVLTLEAPPSGQSAPLLDLQRDAQSGLQTSFLLTWSPPAEPNGRVLHYEAYRRPEPDAESLQSGTATLVCRNIMTACRDEALQPYTVYQYQVHHSVQCAFIFSACKKYDLDGRKYNDFRVYNFRNLFILKSLRRM